MSLVSISAHFSHNATEMIAYTDVVLDVWACTGLCSNLIAQNVIKKWRHKFPTGINWISTSFCVNIHVEYIIIRYKVQRSAWCSRTHFDDDGNDDDEGTVNSLYILSSKEKQRQAGKQTHAIIMNVNNGHYAMVNAS